MATTSVPKAERLRTARALALKEAIDRFEHELMDDEERLILLKRIKRLEDFRSLELAEYPSGRDSLSGLRLLDVVCGTVTLHFVQEVLNDKPAKA